MIGWILLNRISLHCLLSFAFWFLLLAPGLALEMLVTLVLMAVQLRF